MGESYNKERRTGRIEDGKAKGGCGRRRKGDGKESQEERKMKMTFTVHTVETRTRRWGMVMGNMYKKVGNGDGKQVQEDGEW